MLFNPRYGVVGLLAMPYFLIFEAVGPVIELTGSRSQIASRPLPQDDPRQRRPDTTKAESTIGWEPKVPLREGLEKTIAYFNSLLSR